MSGWTLHEIHERAERVSREAPPRPAPGTPGVRLHELVDRLQTVRAGARERAYGMVRALLARFREAPAEARASLSPAVRAAVDGWLLGFAKAASERAVRERDPGALDDAFLALGLAAPGRDVRDVLVVAVLPGRACTLLGCDAGAAAAPSLRLLDAAAGDVVRSAAQARSRDDLRDLCWEERGAGATFEFVSRS